MSKNVKKSISQFWRLTGHRWTPNILLTAFGMSGAIYEFSIPAIVLCAGNMLVIFFVMGYYFALAQDSERRIDELNRKIKRFQENK